MKYYSKVVSLGRIAFNGKRKVNEVELEVTISNPSGEGEELEMRLKIWNATKSATVAGGSPNKSLALLRQHFPELSTLASIWEQWNFNHARVQPDDSLKFITIPDSDIVVLKSLVDSMPKTQNHT